MGYHVDVTGVSTNQFWKGLMLIFMFNLPITYLMMRLVLFDNYNKNANHNLLIQDGVFRFFLIMYSI